MVLNGVKTVVAVVLLMCIAKVTAQANPCLGRPDGFINDYSACRNYFSCYNQRAYSFQCAANLWFNAASSSCDFPENVNCVPCPATGSIMYGIEGSCRGYIRCNNGVSIRMDCGSGNWFDPETLACAGRNANDCPSRHDCPIIGNVYVQANGDTTCLRYTFCTDGRPLGTYSCASIVGSFFNPVVGRCTAGTCLNGVFT